MIKVQTWQALLDALPNCTTLIVGYSGGLDSHVLLHSLLQTKPQFLLVKAVHVHHGLNANADAWVQHCQTVCTRLSVELKIEMVNAKHEVGESPESAARNARYSALKKYQSESTCLVTAHHGDDQTETILLQLFRGAGVRGLSAMADLSFNPNHWRPLLCYERADLFAYAKQHHLQWIEDDSNQNCDLSRNFLRHQIIPSLKSHWPGLTKAMGRVAHNQQDAESILILQAEQDRTLVAGETADALSVSQLLQLPQARQMNVLRYWIRQQNLPMAPLVKLKHVLSDGLRAAVDKMPKITWSGAEIRRFRDDLFVMAPWKSFSSEFAASWDDVTKPFPLPNQAGFLPAPPANLALEGKLTVRFPTPGMKLELPGRVGRRDFKKCCQEWKIPPWQREAIPLIYCGENLKAVFSNNGKKALFLSPEWRSWISV